MKKRKLQRGLKRQPTDSELVQFQGEAAQLLGIPVEAENPKIHDENEEKKLNKNEQDREKK